MKSIWSSPYKLGVQERNWGFTAGTGRYYLYDAELGICFEGVVPVTTTGGVTLPEKFPMSGQLRP